MELGRSRPIRQAFLDKRRSEAGRASTIPANTEVGVSRMCDRPPCRNCDTRTKQPFPFTQCPTKPKFAGLLPALSRGAIIET